MRRKTLGKFKCHSVQNPHFADGVILTPAAADYSTPAIYTIPDGLTLNAGATIYMRDPLAPDGAPQDPADLGTPSVTFEFLGNNGLHFADPTAFFQLYEGTRDNMSASGNAPARMLTLNLNGKDITSAAGAGVFRNGIPGRDNMELTIHARDVTLDRIDLTRGDSQWQDVLISAEGSVDIGFISTADTSDGGNSGGNVDITASQISIRRGISTFTDRADSVGTNGDITLTALKPPGFDATSDLNTKDNSIFLSGLIKTNGFNAGQPVSGHLKLTAPFIELAADAVLNLDESSTTAIHAGQLKHGWTADELFDNNSASAASANFTTNWDGRPVPEPSTAVLVGCALFVLLVGRFVRG